MLARLAGFTFRHRFGVLGVAGAWFIVAIAILSSGLGRLSTGSIRGLESDRAGQVIDSILGRAPDTTFVAIFRAPSLDVTGDRFRQAMEDALAPLLRDPRIASVTTPFNAGPLRAGAMTNEAAHAAYALVAVTGDPFRQAMENALAPLVRDPRVASVTTPFNAGPLRAGAMANEAAHTAYALVAVIGDFSQAAHAYPALREELRSDVLSITCTGRLAFMHDLDRTLEHDLFRAEALSLPVCVLLLGAVFGTAVAALLPVCVGALAVVSGLAAVVVCSRFVELAQYTLNVCSLIGLGVAIDYSLFIVSRYREELAGGLGYPEALRSAMAKAGRVVLFSGFAVTVGLAGLLFFSHSYLSAMGLGGAIVVGFAILFALTFLPALLAVLGPRIHAGRLPFTIRADASRWHRMALWVMRRPLMVLGPSLCALLVMGMPFLRLRMAASDVRVLPRGTEAREGYELLRQDFPDAAANHVLAAVEFPTQPTLTPARIEALYDMAQRAAALPYVTKVQSIVDPSQGFAREAWPDLLLSPPPAFRSLIAQAMHLSVGHGAVLVDITTDKPPESDEARAIVRALRSSRHVADGTLVVGGQTATDVDTTQYILDRSPRVIVFVVVVTYLVLFFLLGSVLLPLKAVAMNFLSIAGSFGALVWIFQEGHAFVHTPRPVEPSLPVLLFCMLFGLSMDYEVLMLTRMKEAYDRTHDNRLAVATGLEKSAGLITSAAAIMVAVFAAFALAQVVLIQAVGFGMALAVALDATLVRVLVVPATMRLLGHLNWWAPKPLARFARAAGLSELH